MMKMFTKLATTQIMELDNLAPGPDRFMGSAIKAHYKRCTRAPTIESYHWLKDTINKIYS